MNTRENGSDVESTKIRETRGAENVRLLTSENPRNLTSENLRYLNQQPREDIFTWNKLNLRSKTFFSVLTLHALLLLNVELSLFLVHWWECRCEIARCPPVWPPPPRKPSYPPTNISGRYRGVFRNQYGHGNPFQNLQGHQKNSAIFFATSSPLKDKNAQIYES